MNTSVTDDRQDDFETWYADHYKTTKPIRRSPEGMKSHCPDLHYNSFPENMAYAAWQAALRSQGKVVKAGDLIALREEVRVQASLKDHYADWEEAERMFTAIIGEGD